MASDRELTIFSAAGRSSPMVTSSDWVTSPSAERMARASADRSFTPSSVSESWPMTRFRSLRSAPSVTGSLSAMARRDFTSASQSASSPCTSAEAMRSSFSANSVHLAAMSPSCDCKMLPGTLSASLVRSAASLRSSLAALSAACRASSSAGAFSSACFMASSSFSSARSVFSSATYNARWISAADCWSWSPSGRFLLRSASAVSSAAAS